MATTPTATPETPAGVVRNPGLCPRATLSGEWMRLLLPDLSRNEIRGPLGKCRLGQFHGPPVWFQIPFGPI
jgi:hypothetical protein